MKTKLYVISAVIFAALGLSLFLSPPAQAEPICGDNDYTAQICAPKPVECHDADPTAIGPCVPINYATVNCDTFKSYEGPVRCTSVKACINDRGVAQAACLVEWKTCRDKYIDPQGKMKTADREGCMNAVATGTAYAPVAEGENKTSCAIEGVGWIVCPVMRFMAQVVDGAYGLVSKFLTVPSIDTNTGSDMYKAWSVMRNFANVAFVIAFLFIIYSQITGVGIGNHGIKVMLPKLIMAAIAVNVCYWLCAIAVDVSNIAGFSFKGLLEGAGNQLYTPGGGVASGAGGKWDVITVGVLGAGAAGVALYAGLTALLPMLIMAVLAIVTVVLVLTMRQALIIILIVISPLAFVALLLPNTQSLFSKWRSLFQTLLLIFPILSIIFGGSALAATIITNSAKGDFVLQVIGAGVTILPLFVTPLVLKTINGTLSRLGVNINDPTKGPFDRMKKGAEGYRNNRQQLRDARALNGGARFGGGLVRRKAERQAVLSQRERNYNNAKAGYIANESLSNKVGKGQQALSWATVGDMGGKTKGDQLLSKMAKGGGETGRSAALAQAVSIQARIEAEEVTAASAVIKNMNLDRNQGVLQQLSQGKAAGGLDGSNAAVRAAAMKNVVDNHDVEGVNQLLDQVGTMDQRTRAAFADSLATSSQKPEYVGQAAITNIRQHGNEVTDGNGKTTIVQAATSTELTVAAINNNTYSVDKLATGDPHELAHVAKIADTATGVDATAKAGLVKNAQNAQTDPRYSGRISKNAEVVNKIANL